MPRRSDVRRAAGLYALLAAVNLVGVAGGVTALQWATKPFLALVLAYAVWRATGNRRDLMVVGLICAAFGDTVLEVHGLAAFTIGMLGFLAMQACYIRSFWALDRRASRTAGAVAAVVWLAANAALAPRLGFLAIPVAVYSAALVRMAASASALGRLGLIGGVLFVVSDGLIGVGAAGGGFAGRDVIVMATYIVAQGLLTAAYLDGYGARGDEARQADQADQALTSPTIPITAK